LGKSRLLEEFHARLSDTPHTWVEWSCSQLLQNTPLHPIAEWGRARFGGADVRAERRLAELESSLAQVKLDHAENASLLAPLLDIPLPKERVPTLAAEELRRRQLAALTNWVIAGAKSQPLVLAFEDLHWADPTTLDVLRGIAERGALAPLLVVATTRPEFRPPWGMRSHHGTISLAPLDRGQVQEMVAELSARHALPRNVVEDVASRTGGVPLFVEEVTRLLLERGEGGGGIQAIPATLQQSLMARLDRLGPAREVAQIGAVIGRGFSYKLLQAVAEMDDAPLEAALEKLSEADIVLVDGVLPESDYRFKHALIQDAAYENLLKSRRQVLHRRIAETLRDHFADKAAAEPEVLAHHFTQAGLTDAAIEWWGRAGDQALRRSAFQEAISHLGKAIDMADKTAEAAPHAAAAPVSADQRVKLQTNYGQALTWGKGYAAPETAAAFARARDLGANAGDATARFETYYGQWAGSFMRGDYASCRDTAAAFLHDAEGAARMPEIAAAHRMIGLTLHLQGAFVDARPHFVEALRIYDPRWDHDTKIHIGHDTGACATAYLARVNWVLGELGQTRELMDDALARAVESGHVPTLANTHYHKTLFELQRGNTEAAWRDAERVLQLGRQHELPTYLAFGSMSRGYARACLGERDAGIAELRDGLTAYIEQRNKVWVPYYQALLASLEGEGRDAEGPLRRIDEALGLAGVTSEHENDALLHHIRGEIILKLDPANTAPAEEAFLTAIAIAQQQKARSFELRAALALAKLYQSSNRTADAHAVLAPALEGFSATPEFPEIKEAQALLAAFSDTDEVKSATASRHHRLQLQVSLGNALIAARGHQSLETAAAFARARELAVGIEDAPERFSALFGVWLGGITRAELAPAREAAEALLREAKRRPQSAEAGAAHRVFAVTSSVQGNFVDARKHFEQALAILESTPDGELGFRFGDDPAVAAMIRLAQAIWALGEADLARLHADRAVSQATQGGHVPSICYAYGWKAAFEAMRHDVGRARADAERVIALSTQHSLPMWLAVGTVVYRWARCRLGDKGFGAAEIRDSNKVLDEMGLRLMQPLFAALIAEAEANEDRIEASLAVLECELVETKRTGFCWHDAELHRIRGEVLLKRDPANPAPAEESFLTAIAIAKRQQARSFELRAALPLAKLYQSMGRPADAHAVLAPALEGFSPTPEFLEIEQAHSLLDASAS
jgi:predicted ATPase